MGDSEPAPARTSRASIKVPDSYEEDKGSVDDHGSIFVYDLLVLLVLPSLQSFIISRHRKLTFTQNIYQKYFICITDSSLSQSVCSSAHLF